MYWFCDCILIKLCIEFIILNLTDIIDKVVVTNNNFIKYNVFLKNKFLLCMVIKCMVIKCNDNNSTKSQLHQPPQESSCSAHQAPKEIDTINNIIKTLPSIIFECVLNTLYLPKSMLLCFNIGKFIKIFNTRDRTRA